MHQVLSMSRRSHRSLRLGALALLAAAAIWPRAGVGMASARVAPTHSVATTAETTAAKLVSAPRTAKLAVAQTNDADDSQINN